MLPLTHRFIARCLAVGALPLVMTLTGCSSDSSLGVVTPPPIAGITDTFSDTLTVNAAKTYPFVVTGPGTLTAQVLTLSPDPTQIIGIALGTWNGTTCQLVLANDAAIEQSTVVGQASVLGNFCVRVYDSTGHLAQPASYVLEVTHP
jgi:hypothetical protein